MPRFDLPEPVRRLVRTAYDGGWVLSDFDWLAWVGTPEARRLQEDRGALAQATPDRIARLLTVLLRRDRFAEGTLAGACRSGLLTAVLRRADRLRRELADAEA